MIDIRLIDIPYFEAEKSTIPVFIKQAPLISAPPIEHCRYDLTEVCCRLVVHTRLSTSEVNDIYMEIMPLINKAYDCGVNAEKSKTKAVIKHYEKLLKKGAI